MGQPTYDQVVDEARRRRHAAGYGPGANLGSPPLEYFIIETVREGWTPPEPVVDRDVVAFDEWWAIKRHTPTMVASTGGWRREAYLAGARMAREQEQERANHPVAFIVRLMAGVFKDLDHAKREAPKVLANYRGDA
jgi:hypothetical protein